MLFAKPSRLLSLRWIGFSEDDDNTLAEGAVLSNAPGGRVPPCLLSLQNDARDGVVFCVAKSD
jgi:hypothetical protein